MSLARQGFVWTASVINPVEGGRLEVVGSEGQTPEEAIAKFNAKTGQSHPGGIIGLEIKDSQEFHSLADMVYARGFHVDHANRTVTEPEIKRGFDASNDLASMIGPIVAFALKSGLTLTLGGNPLQLVYPGMRVAQPVAQFRPVDGYVVVYNGFLPDFVVRTAIYAADELMGDLKGKAFDRAMWNRRIAYNTYCKEGLL